MTPVEAMAARFWAKVDRRGEHDCWPWMGGKSNRGYGGFNRGGVSVKAHRFAYELATGTAPGRMFVCHRCDNPPCCNPAHLFLGTCADNVADMVAKGRHVRPPRDESAVKWRRGEKSPNAKLTTDDVLSIRARRAAGEQLKVIAADYGVHKSLICHIAKGRGWYHV